MLDKKLRVLLIGIAVFLAAAYLITYIGTPQEQISPSDVEDKTLSDRKNWVEEKSETEGFSILFPVKPQKVSKNVSIPGSDLQEDNDVYLAQTPNGTVLMVRVATYPEGYQIPDAVQHLKGTMEEILAKSSENILREIRETTFDGFPAIDFSIQNQESRTDARAILRDGRQYLIAYVAPLTFYEGDIYEYFKDSFKFSK
ncbi:MAG: hypothetical protein KDK48_05845 [Chlamydiia bacterium]|nr:hypothetical protein [Chlamydiia bacterium]